MFMLFLVFKTKQNKKTLQAGRLVKLCRQTQWLVNSLNEKPGNTGEDCKGPPPPP